MTIHKKEQFSEKRGEGGVGTLFTIIIIAILLSFGMFLVVFIPNIPIGAGQAQTVTLPSIIDSLQVNGATLSDTGELITSPLSVDGIIYTINKEQVIFFQFKSINDAITESQLISGNGSIINGKSYAWQAAPHFYRSGSIIALYVGSSGQIQSLLAYILGTQFAGQSQGQSAVCSIEQPCPRGNSCVSFAGETMCIAVEPCSLCGTLSCKKVNTYPIEVICSR